MTTLRTLHDLAATVRGRRLDLGLSQADLARRAGVSRKWINEIEAGKPSAEIGLVLRIVDALGMVLDVAVDRPVPRESTAIDLDAILDEHRSR